MADNTFVPQIANGSGAPMEKRSAGRCVTKRLIEDWLPIAALGEESVHIARLRRSIALYERVVPAKAP